MISSKIGRLVFTARCWALASSVRACQICTRKPGLAVSEHHDTNPAGYFMGAVTTNLNTKTADIRKTAFIANNTELSGARPHTGLVSAHSCRVSCQCDVWTWTRSAWTLWWWDPRPGLRWCAVAALWTITSHILRNMLFKVIWFSAVQPSHVQHFLLGPCFIC